VCDAENIATMFLRDTFHARALTLPFSGNDAAASVGGGLFQAGGFRDYEPAQRSEHLRQPRFQEAQEFFGEIYIGHGADMLSMPRDQSNEAKFIGVKKRPAI
jgi:hypothetical protein